MLNIMQLAWQFYSQERHHNHQRFLRWTQAILLVFIVALSLSSHTVQTYLTKNLNNMLGADVVIGQMGPASETVFSSMSKRANAVVITRSVKTTLTHNDKWQRVTLKAVGNDYPLHGELKTSSDLDTATEVSRSGPKAGEIWMDSRLLSGLSAKIGDVILIAKVPLILTRLIHHEPDRLMEGHNVDMRALIHESVFDKLGITIDIVKHRYLLGASGDQINDILNWQKSTLPAAEVYHKQGAHPLALFWKRTENFVGLASIILFFMAAIAIQQLTHVQTKKEQYFTAVCLSLGATRLSSFQISLLKWIFQLVTALPLVMVLSTTLHWLAVQWLAKTFPAITWQWHLGVAFKAYFSVCFIFVVFQVPVWLGLKKTSVAQLINLRVNNSKNIVLFCCALLVLCLVTIRYTDNGLLTVMLLGSMAICVLTILLLSWGMLSVGEKLTSNISGLLPFSFFMMKQRLVSKSTQILGVGLCAFLLLFTLMLLKDIGSSMQAYQRQHDGNLVVSQADSEQMSDISNWANQQNVDVRQIKPFIYAKLSKVNGLLLSGFVSGPSESMSTFMQPIRMHWTDGIPANNRVVDGKWWVNQENNWQQVSIEEEVMTDLGLKIGDKVEFSLADQSVELEIVASHVYKPGAGSITFWVQIPPSAISHIEATHYHMASLEVSQEKLPFLSQLWQKHPTLRMVSLNELTKQFDDMLNMITKIISAFSILIILLASIVILASIQALESKEKKKNSIIMSFGFTKRTCLKLNAIEWLVTGSIAAFGAIFSTWVAGELIYQSQFSMMYKPDFLWLFGTLTIILSFVLSLGIFASKNGLNSSIRELMAE